MSDFRGEAGWKETEPTGVSGLPGSDLSEIVNRVTVDGQIPTRLGEQETVERHVIPLG
jgi:hypothetical protein